MLAVGQFVSHGVFPSRRDGHTDERLGFAFGKLYGRVLQIFG